MNTDKLIDIPTTARGWLLKQTPINARLRNALHKRHFRRLGELHGMSLDDVWSIRGCGVGSIADFQNFLARLQAGEFERLAAVSPVDALGQIVSILDRFCTRLDERDQDIVLSRLGAHEEPLTLAEIGLKYRLTRERVRQVVNVRLGEMCRHGGPPFQQLMQAATKRCEETVCPLTPALLSHWIRPNQPHRFQPSFYVRAIAVLAPECPAWPEQRDGGVPSKRQAMITTEIKRLLWGRLKPLSAQDVLQPLKVQRKFSSVDAIEFLHAIRADSSLGIHFGQPDQLLVLPPAPKPEECVKLVLFNSDCPLNLDEIKGHARRIWGDKALSLPSYRLTCTFRPEDGIYLLGANAYGLRKHIRLSESDWTSVRDDVHHLLEGDTWNVSAFDIVKKDRFAWASTINGYELAVILRDDPRFTETERGSFMLTIPTLSTAIPSSVAVALQA